MLVSTSGTVKAAGESPHDRDSVGTTTASAAASNPSSSTARNASATTAQPIASGSARTLTSAPSALISRPRSPSSDPVSGIGRYSDQYHSRALEDGGVGGGEQGGCRVGEGGGGRHVVGGAEGDRGCRPPGVSERLGQQFALIGEVTDVLRTLVGLRVA